MDHMQKRISCARGEIKADLVIKNGQIINVFTREIIHGDIAVCDGVIAGIGKYEGLDEIDASGKFVCPGLIDGHVHIESSLVTPAEFARAILRHGTTAIIADPHEIANVCGKSGIQYMLEETKAAPVRVYLMAPSCVPGLNAKELLQLKEQSGRIIGLGEVMETNAVIAGEPELLQKLCAFAEDVIDGHAPLLAGKDLNAYCAAGIMTDHECAGIGEVVEKLQLGMYIQIREGSAAKNLEEIVTGLMERGMGFDRCVFCTDDKQLSEIKEKGHIDYNVKRAMELGVSPFDAIRMATQNTAQCYRLKNTGAIAPGYHADLLILKDLKNFEIESVIIKGRPVDGQNEAAPAPDESVLHTVKIKNVALQDLRIPLQEAKANIIQLIPGQILTKKVWAEVKTADGLFLPDRRYAKLCVVERHRASGNIGLGIVEGFDIQNGAIGSTVAHDAHNMIIAGDNDEDILLAIQELNRCGGGFTVARGGKIIDTFALPVAGLMSEWKAEEAEEKLENILKSAYTVCGSRGFDPFITLSFLSLTVIPEIRITEMGVYDVANTRYL